MMIGIIVVAAIVIRCAVKIITIKNRFGSLSRWVVFLQNKNTLHKQAQLIPTAYPQIENKAKAVNNSTQLVAANAKSLLSSYQRKEEDKNDPGERAFTRRPSGGRAMLAKG